MLTAVNSACSYEYQSPVIATRTVGYSAGSAAAQTQSFAYVTNWDSTGVYWTSKVTTVMTTDNVTGLQSKTVYTYGAIGQEVQVNDGGVFQGQIPVETQIQYFDWGKATTPLKTVNETWADQYQMTSQQTMLNTGQSTEDLFCYYGTTQVAEMDEYGFGVTVPAPSSAKSGDWVAASFTCGQAGASRRTTYGMNCRPHLARQRSMTPLARRLPRQTATTTEPPFRP